MMKPIRPHITKGATYPPEFREEAVRYWLSSGQTLAAVSTDLDLSPECLRSWRKPMEAVMTPTDRGSQYASELFRNFLQDNEVTQSMSRTANCYDNALMESFWATLKTECFDNFRDGIPATRQEAKQKLFSYIEVFYNRKRLHSSLGYQAPVAFEQHYLQQNLPKEENLSLSVST